MAGREGTKVPLRLSRLLTAVRSGDLLRLRGGYAPLHFNGFYDDGLVGLLWRFPVNTSLAFLFTWIYSHSRGSMLLALLLHTAVNFTPSFGGSGEAGSAGLYIFLGVVVVLVLAGRMWRRVPAPEASLVAPAADPGTYAR